ncbi:hypothetical protein DS259_23875 [Salmonella enterica subsp. indica]|nr:hypothetical protein [Salmonella enterica subsp. indica]
MQILRLAQQEMQLVGQQLELLADLRINLVVVLPEVGHQAGQDHVKYVFCTEKSALIAQKTSDKVAQKTVF